MGINMNGILSKAMLTTAVLSCVTFSLALSATLLTPRRQVVPEGETFQLTCMSMHVKTNGTEYRSELYKVTGSRERLPVPADVAEPCKTRYVKEQGNPPRISLTTTFTLTATGESAGKYGCLPVPENGSLPTTFSSKLRKNEVTVRVCREPELQVNRSGSAPIVFNCTEKCGYPGELTWLVNGHRVPRATRATDSSPAVERDDDTLEILSTGCRDGETCEVTAEFTYISEDRLSNVRKTQLIEDCCIASVFPGRDFEGTDNTGTDYTHSEETSPVVFPSHPIDALTEQRQLETEKLTLEKEVLSLQKDVLGLKKTALPLQIKFLRRLSKDHATAREMERLTEV